MNKEELLRLRKSVEAQLRWALRHNGDEELVNILHSESERISAMIERCPMDAGLAPAYGSGQLQIPRSCGVPPSIAEALADDLREGEIIGYLEQ